MFAEMLSKECCKQYGDEPLCWGKRCRKCVVTHCGVEPLCWGTRCPKSVVTHYRLCRYVWGVGADFVLLGSYVADACRDAPYCLLYLFSLLCVKLFCVL